MISELAHPTVCVIDDEPDDYKPILECLNKIFVSAVHLTGEIDGLPPAPFDRVRLVFLDLHLTASSGKDAASYTANFFRRAISTESSPVVVVIWSKYADDKVNVSEPPEDNTSQAEEASTGEASAATAGENDTVTLQVDETEAELFKRTLLGAETKFDGRLLFVQMSKPKPSERPADWSERLKAEIDAVLSDQQAIKALWAWDSLAKDASAKIAQDLTLVAQTALPAGRRDLKEGLKATMQRLARAQSVGDLDADTAPRYLAAVLTQLLADQLEYSGTPSDLSAHGSWLCEHPPGSVPADFPANTNGFLLTSGLGSTPGIYLPGTIYCLRDETEFKNCFGKKVSDLLACWVKEASPHFETTKKQVKPVLIELSPVCDLAQGKRVSSLLVAGVIVPTSFTQFTRKTGDAFGSIVAPFHLRWPLSDFPEQAVTLHYCYNFKTALPVHSVADWLVPWFRIRDLPLASIRNSQAAHSARVGYVSL